MANNGTFLIRSWKIILKVKKKKSKTDEKLHITYEICRTLKCNRTKCAKMLLQTNAHKLRHIVK